MKKKDRQQLIPEIVNDFYELMIFDERLNKAWYEGLNKSETIRNSVLESKVTIIQQALDELTRHHAITNRAYEDIRDLYNAGIERNILQK